MKNFLTLSLFMLILTGCEAFVKDKEVDRSFLTREPCAPPCWYNIEPGMKAEKEMISDILLGLPFIQDDSVRVYDVYYPWIDEVDQIEIGYQCIGHQGEFCGGILLANRMVASIWMRVHYPISFNQVVDDLGKPDYYSCFELPGESPGRDISLYWTKRGIIASNFERQSCSNLKVQDGVNPDLGVTSLEYVITKKFDYLRDQDGLLDWSGFDNR